MLTKKPKGFDTTGCWVRVIDPQKEIELLALREELNWTELLRHDNPKQVGYTHYSPCTYIKEGLSISLFAGGAKDNFGVFIRPFSRTIDWWYNGHWEIVTDNIKLMPGKKFDNGGQKTDQLWDASMEEIGTAVLSLRAKYAADPYYKENPDELVTMKWNEGFLRYQRNDITGLLINKNSRSSVYHALAFRLALKVSASLYSYNQSSGICEYMNSEMLCTTLKINTQSSNFKELVVNYRKQFDAYLEETKAQRNELVKHKQYSLS